MAISAAAEQAAASPVSLCIASAFSYAASGALLSRIARRRPADLDASVLLVGDPTGDLPHAQAEVQALREAFYPDAVRWGEPAGLTDGAATPARLRDAPARGGHSLVHYAGHATIDVAHPGSSALVLGGSQRLRADRISRLEPEQPYRVCLAACTTHLTAEAMRIDIARDAGRDTGAEQVKVLRGIGGLL